MTFDGGELRSAVRSVLQAFVAELGAPTVEPVTLAHPDGNRQVVAVRTGYKLEELLGKKVERRMHTFKSIRSFGEWLKRHADPDQVEILGEADQIRAALDPPDPTADLVVCQLEAHPRAKPWLCVFGKKLGQRDLWLFVRSRPQDFGNATGRGGTDLGSFGPLLAGELQKLEVVRGGKVTVEIDGLGNTVFAAAEDKTSVSGKLPPSFEVRLPLFRDVILERRAEDGGEVLQSLEPLYTLEVFLTLQVEEDKRPLFTLECPGLELALMKAREDALQCLRNTLAAPAPEGFLVGLGSVGLQTVPKVNP